MTTDKDIRTLRLNENQYRNNPGNPSFPRYRGHINIERLPERDLRISTGRAPASDYHNAPAVKPDQVSATMILAQDLGDRVMTRCCLPNGDKYPAIIGTMEATLARVFGGFTCYAMIGAWIAGDGTLARETGKVYEVSFPAVQNEQRIMARHIFLTAAREMGEEWVHIENHQFFAAHAKVN